MAINRAEGQLWIDRQAPHGLKYHVDGETFQITPESVQTITSSVAISKGSLLAVGSDGKIKLAQFPKDIDRIIGICPIDISESTPVETSILKNGNITLAQNSAVFEHTDVSVTWGNMIGAPVYWFIGRTNRKIVNDTVTYPYIDPKDNLGKLTLSTPSGIRWGTGVSCDDNSLNVGYSNLPVVGTVVSVSSTDVTINVNISKFESSMEWNWPYYSKVGSSSSDEILGNMEIPIRHGLFPSIMTAGTENYYNFRPRCFCDVIILESNNNDTEHKALAGIDNYYGLTEGQSADSDKRTEILIKSNILSDSKKRINVSGKVVYTFVKQYE